MQNDDRRKELVQQLTACQTRLYGFILTQIPSRERAQDVLQETNLVIWEKADEFAPGTNFWAWASQIARLRVLGYYRDAGRDRHVFSETVLDQLAALGEEISGDEAHRRALRACLKKLTQQQAELIRERYYRSQSVLAIAESKGQSLSAVKMALYRVRRSLLSCIEGSLQTEQRS